MEATLKSDVKRNVNTSAVVDTMSAGLTDNYPTMTSLLSTVDRIENVPTKN